MGYRSHVLYAIVGPKDQMIAFVVAARLQGHGKALDECAFMDHDEPGMKLLAAEFQDVKWYPDYEDVKTHEALWSYAMDDEKLSGRFVRVGEDTIDIEERSFGEANTYDLASVSVNVETSIDFSKKEPVPA